MPFEFKLIESIFSFFLFRYLDINYHNSLSDGFGQVFIYI